MRKNILSCLVALPLVLATPWVLQGCVAPALMLSPQSQLMWALLKPMVGLDPKEVNLFKQEIIRSRLQPLLGQHYETAIQLLETADQIQQEGPLFYVASKYTPLPQVAEKAGFVWNSETNQMAVLLVSGGAPQIFAEKLNNQLAEQVPAWPKELADYTDPNKLKQKALTQASQQVDAMLPDEMKQLKAQAEQVQSQIDNVQAQVDAVKNIPMQAEQQVSSHLKATVPAQQLTEQLTQQQQAMQQLAQPKQSLQQAVTEARQQTTVLQSAVDQPDELLAELAEEQQQMAVINSKTGIQQQLTTIEQQLKQSKDEAEIKVLQQKRSALQQQLDALSKE